MDKNEKLEIMQKLKEDSLTSNVIIPLLEKMGFKNITLTHGTNEKGIDLIFYKENDFGEREYTGVQVKAVKIHGSAGKKGNATEILTQAHQAFAYDFHDIYDNNVKYIDRYLVITSREITKDARESVKDQLIEMRKNKIIQFIDGNKLVDLIDQNMQSFFWKEYDFFNKYFIAMKEDFETIRDVSAIGQKEVLRLESIYVPLQMKEKTKQREIPIDLEKEKDLKIFNETVKAMEGKPGTMVRRERVVEVDTAVSDFHKLVVVGAPGAGKTTLLKHLALKYCKENIEKMERITVPIPVSLREFIQGGKGLRDYINTVFEKYCFPKAKEFVEKDLESGKCMMLLDGFDELATREYQAQVSKEIQQFLNQYPYCQVLVTSRTAGYHDELTGFTCLELMEFDTLHVEQFIDKWFGGSHPKKAASMLMAVKENENISNLARNPLMIAIIAIIYEEDRELPQRRAALYQRAVEVLLSKWDIQKKLKNQFSSEMKEFILRKLALENQTKNRRAISEAAILDIIKQYAPQIQLKMEYAETFLKEIWERSYLLRQIAMGTYEFLHLSFQEYFTALELTKQADDIGTIIAHIDKPWWEEPIRLYAGLSEDAGPLIKRIQNEVPEDIFYSNLMLLGKCIADAEFTEPELKEEIIQNIWSIYNKGEFQLLRHRAMDILSRLKPPNIIDSLIKQLKDEDSNVQERAVKALGDIGSTEAIPQLIRILTSNKHSKVRGRAAEALAAIGSHEALPQLIRMLKIHKKSSVRRNASYVLGAIGNIDAIPHLLHALDSDKDCSVQERVVETLGIIKSSDTIPLLIQVLNTHKNSSVQGRAANALGTIRNAETVPHLIQAFTTHKESNVRWRTAEALGRIGSTEPISQLIKALTTHKESDIRWSAAHALGKIGCNEATPHLIRALTYDQDSSVRALAAEALGAIGSPGSISHLVQVFTTDKESSVRGLAAEALGSIGSIEAIPYLINALNTDKEGSVRRYSAKALGEIGSNESIPHLINSLTTDKDSLVRGCAAEALGTIGNNTSIQTLKQSLKDEDNYYEKKVKDTAFEALYKISRRFGVRIKN